MVDYAYPSTNQHFTYTNFSEKELKDTFALMDIDGDGSITKDEIGSILNRTGFDVSEEQLERIMSELDKDTQGVLSFQNFARMMLSYINLSSPEDELRLVFRTFDKDGNGSICKFEMIVYNHISV